MLRWLIFILLLLNLGLYVWGYLQPQPPQEFVAPLPAGLPTIQLLSEVDRHQSAAEAQGRQESEAHAEGAGPGVASAQAAPHSTVPEQQPTRCLRLGPFDRQAEASAAAGMLNSAGHDTHMQVKIERSQSGYWVLIPPGDEDPEFVIVNLELSGVQDIWRFDKGELAGAISLGLFSDRKQAQARRIELQERGFEAEIRPRQVEKSGYWIESTYKIGDEAAEGAIEQLYVEHHWLGYPPPECKETVTP